MQVQSISNPDDRPSGSRLQPNRLRARCHSYFAPLLFLSIFVFDTDAAETAEPNLETVGELTREAFNRDLAALLGYSFQRQVTRQELDRENRIKNEQVLVMHVTPHENGFDEKLIRIDGHPPTKRQIARHQKARTFERHYNQMTAGRIEITALADITLPLLLDTYHFVYEGVEEVHGVRCYRFAVHPSVALKGASKTERIAAASIGEFLIAADSSSLVRMNTQLIQPVKTLGVGLEHLTLSLESTPQGASWLLSRIEVRATYRMPFTLRKHNIWTYSDFKKLDKS